jgi:hypothetical protein
MEYITLDSHGHSQHYVEQSQPLRKAARRNCQHPSQSPLVATRKERERSLRRLLSRLRGMSAAQRARLLREKDSV